MLQVQKLHKDAKVPVRAHHTDAGFDLFSVEAMMIPPMQWRRVPTGIAVGIEFGKAGYIWPRSGSALNDGIMVMGGLIDAGYHGEVGVILFNADPVRHFVINPGDKITQMVIGTAFPEDIQVVEEFGLSDRGTAGFGSTGKV